MRQRFYVFYFVFGRCDSNVCTSVGNIITDLKRKLFEYVAFSISLLCLVFSLSLSVFLSVFLYYCFFLLFILKNHFYPYVSRVAVMRWQCENTIITIWNRNIIVISFDGRRCRFFYSPFELIWFSFNSIQTAAFTVETVAKIDY